MKAEEMAWVLVGVGVGVGAGVALCLIGQAVAAHIRTADTVAVRTPSFELASLHSATLPTPA